MRLKTTLRLSLYAFPKIRSCQKLICLYSVGKNRTCISVLLCFGHIIYTFYMIMCYVKLDWVACALSETSGMWVLYYPVV